MKKLIVLILVIVFIFTITWMQQTNNRHTYNYNYAYVELPNGECVEGKVKSWKDFDDGDQIQVNIDGTTYLTNSTRIVLVAK